MKAHPLLIYISREETDSLSPLFFVTFQPGAFRRAVFFEETIL